MCTFLCFAFATTVGAQSTEGIHKMACTGATLSAPSATSGTGAWGWGEKLPAWAAGATRAAGSEHRCSADVEDDELDEEEVAVLLRGAAVGEAGANLRVNSSTASSKSDARSCSNSAGIWRRSHVSRSRFKATASGQPWPMPSRPAAASVAWRFRRRPSERLAAACADTADSRMYCSTVAPPQRPSN